MAVRKNHRTLPKSNFYVIAIVAMLTVDQAVVIMQDTNAGVING